MFSLTPQFTVKKIILLKILLLNHYCCEYSWWWCHHCVVGRRDFWHSFVFCIHLKKQLCFQPQKWFTSSHEMSPSFSFWKWLCDCRCLSRPLTSNTKMVSWPFLVLSSSCEDNRRKPRTCSTSALLHISHNPFLCLIGFPSIRSFITTSMHVKEAEMNRGVSMQGGNKESTFLWNGRSGGEAGGYEPLLVSPEGEY